MSRSARSGLAIGVVLAAAVGFFLWMMIAEGPGLPGDAKRPNVILISVDTLRRDHLSFYGYPLATSPHLAELAAQSWVFDNAYAAHTNTGPSHASMLTGRVVPVHGLLQNGHRLREDVPVLGELLRLHGYQTAAFVSGFTLDSDTTGLDRGFEHYDDGESRVRDRTANDTIQEVIDWLGGRRSRAPLFLFVHLFDPHFPY